MPRLVRARLRARGFPRSPFFVLVLGHVPSTLSRPIRSMRKPYPPVSRPWAQFALLPLEDEDDDDDEDERKGGGSRDETNGLPVKECITHGHKHNRDLLIVHLFQPEGKLLGPPGRDCLH